MNRKENKLFERLRNWVIETMEEELKLFEIEINLIFKDRSLIMKDKNKSKN